jgi:nucleotide-binding universal stress UspA family protein
MNSLAVNCAGAESEGSDHPRAAGNGGAGGRKFLVPISLSQRSHETLALAIALASQSSGQLVLLHAVELNIAGEERGIGRGQLLLELMIAADLRLMELARSMCRDVPFRVVVTEGPPAEVILRAARTLSVDAIVMGARVQRGLWWLRRNNLRAVLRKAPRPVYVVAPMEDLNRIRPQGLAADPGYKEAGRINGIAGNTIPQFAIQQFPATIARLH